MLVVLGPTFDGSEASYARLAHVTGMLAYDLKARLKPGVWGVVKALADHDQAADLEARLRAEGFEPLLISPDVAHDATRNIARLQALELGERDMTLYVEDRAMTVPYAALVCVVRGEVQPGRTRTRSQTPTSSSSTFRAVAPGALADVQATNAFQAFAAADLHFATVLWIGRIDARNFDFRALNEPSESSVHDLDRLVEQLANLSGVRVDRSVRASSVASFAERPQMRGSTPPAVRGRELAGDERFDPYSRLIGEAERKLALSRLV